MTSDRVRVGVVPATVRVRLVRCVLWGLVAVGAAAGVLAWASGGGAVPEPASQGPSSVVSPTVAGVAERAAGTWVADGAGLEVMSVSAVDSSPAGDGWSVTVAVDIAERVDDERVLALWWVGVTVDSAGRVVGGPAVVPPPLLVGEQVSPDGLGPPDADDPVASTASGFLAALLAGEGSVDPYLAEGAEPVAASGVFTSVEVERLSATETSPGALEVFVEVSSTTAGGAQRDVFYELVLVGSGERWLVESFGPPGEWGGLGDLTEPLELGVFERSDSSGDFSSAPGA